MASISERQDGGFDIETGDDFWDVSGWLDTKGKLILQNGSNERIEIPAELIQSFLEAVKKLRNTRSLKEE